MFNRRSNQFNRQPIVYKKNLFAFWQSDLLAASHVNSNLISLKDENDRRQIAPSFAHSESASYRRPVASRLSASSFASSASYKRHIASLVTYKRSSASFAPSAYIASITFVPGLQSAYSIIFRNSFALTSSSGFTATPRLGKHPRLPKHQTRAVSRFRIPTSVNLSESRRPLILPVFHVQSAISSIQT